MQIPCSTKCFQVKRIFCIRSWLKILQRHILYRISYKLISAICTRTDHKKGDFPTVLIADDFDLPKTGYHIEGIGKVFSHVHQHYLVGFKAFTLSWSNGRSQFILDFSLHGKKGKKEGRE